MIDRVKNVLINIFWGLVTLAAIGLISYPYVSFLLADKNQTVVIQEYDHHLKALDTKEKKEAWDLAATYNSNLFSSVQVDPFSIENSGQNEEYFSLLNLRDDGMMGYLKIPRIKVELPVYHGVSENVLQMGVGHMEGTSLPVGGEGTHTVLTGHTGLNNSKLFSDLEKLQIGDEFYLYILGEILAYRIDQIDVVLPHETENLVSIYGHDYATLVTCTPYGVNTHRLLLRGERVPYTQEEIEQKVEQTKTVMGREMMLLLGGISILAVWVMINIIYASRRKKRQNVEAKRFAHLS